MEGRYIQIVLILAYLVFSFSSCTGYDKYENNEYLRLSHTVEDGDIILRKGKGVISHLIAQRLNDTVDYSHCGIVVRDGDTAFSVIHSLSKKVSAYDGMQKCSLREFVEESRRGSVTVVRYRGDSLHRISPMAWHYLSAGIPFDEEYNIRDTSSFFCSELPIRIIYKCYGDSLCSFDSSAPPKFSVFLNRRKFIECR